MKGLEQHGQCSFCLMLSEFQQFSESLWQSLGSYSSFSFYQSKLLSPAHQMSAVFVLGERKVDGEIVIGGVFLCTSH